MENPTLTCTPFNHDIEIISEIACHIQFELFEAHILVVAQPHLTPYIFSP